VLSFAEALRRADQGEAYAQAKKKVVKKKAAKKKAVKKAGKAKAKKWMGGYAVPQRRILGFGRQFARDVSV
jgi:hypothetical protein